MKAGAAGAAALGTALALAMGFVGANAAAQSARVIPGSSVASGIGQFGDASSLHGLVLGVQGGLGTWEDSQTFGQTSTSLSLQYTPGDETQFGGWLRLSVLLGGAQWVSPSPASVYPAASLSAAEIEAAASGTESRTEESPLVGMALGFGSRSSETDLTAEEAAALGAATMAMHNEPAGSPEWRAARQRTRELLWKANLRVLRSPVAKIGAFGRIDSLATKAPIQAFDTFAAGAWGRGMSDVTAAVHYLHYLDDRGIADHAWSGSLGAFLDLASAPPVPTLGLTASLGRYWFRARRYPSAEGTERTRPATTRLDVILSLSGAPATDATHTAGLGFRYGREWRHDGSRADQFLFLMTSNFRVPLGI